MRVLVLLHENLIPPEVLPTGEELMRAEWKTEYHVIADLTKNGHTVQVLGVASDLQVIRETLLQFKPNIVFNLLEEFAGEAVFDQHVVSFLEMQGIKYTGCNPRGLVLARDKALSKKIMAYHRVLTPDFMVFKKTNNLKLSKKIKYPLFVKTLNEEASLGITQDCIVNNQAELKERVEHFFDKHNTDVIAETYIEGREFYVGIVGNSRLQALPPWELFFKNASERVPRIATSKVKWDMNYRRKYGIETGPADGISEDLMARMKRLCRRVYKALHLSGYARMDLRVDSQGRIFFIEANPNPDIGDGEDLAASAAAIGLRYPALLDRILHLGLAWTP